MEQIADRIANLSNTTKIGLAGLMILVMLGFALYATLNESRSEGVQREAQLNAQYLSNQNELSSYIAQFYESLGIADRKSGQLDRILTDAIKGRYDGTDVNAAPLGQGGQFISALIEAYPDLSGLNSYDRILDIVTAGRNSYKAKQNLLLDLLREYDTWRETGLVKSWMLRSLLHYPTQRLEARVGTTIWRGSDARNKMYQIVLVGDAVRAYETGTMEPLELPTLAP